MEQNFINFAERKVDLSSYFRAKHPIARRSNPGGVKHPCAHGPSDLSTGKVTCSVREYPYR